MKTKTAIEVLAVIIAVSGWGLSTSTAEHVEATYDTNELQVKATPNDVLVEYRTKVPLCAEFLEAREDRLTVRRSIPAPAANVRNLCILLRFAKTNGKVTITVGKETKAQAIGPEDWTARFVFDRPETMEYLKTHHKDFAVMVRTTGQARVGVYAFDTSPNVEWSPGGEDGKHVLYGVTFTAFFNTNDRQLAKWKHYEPKPQPRTKPEIRPLQLTAQPLKRNRQEPRGKVNLNGIWELAFGPGGKIPTQFPARVRVPGVWADSEGLSESDKKTHTLWYRTQFMVPATFSAKSRLALNFGKVSYKCAVFVNGQEAGSHEGDIDPFSCDVTNIVRRDGANELVVFVQDHYAFIKRPERTMDRVTQQLLYNQPDKSETMAPWAGILGDVTLESRPKTHIADVFVTTSVRQRHIVVRTQLSDPAFTGTVAHSVYKDGKKVLDLPEGLNVSATWANPQLWDIDNPVMYSLRTSLFDNSGRLVDRCFTRFGFREFWIEGTVFYLNGRPIRLQGDSPSIAHYRVLCESRSLYRTMFQLYRYMNANFVRLHLSGMNCPPFVESADEMGMLVTLEAPYLDWAWFWDEAKQELIPGRLDTIKEQYGQWAKRFRNHPSVIFYSLQNEFWAGGDPVEDPKAVNAMMKKMSVWETLNTCVVEADPSRLTQMHGMQGFWWAKPEGLPWMSVANWHDVWRWDDTTDWPSRVGGRPIIMGEFAFESNRSSFRSQLADRIAKGKDVQNFYWDKINSGMKHVKGTYLDQYRINRIPGVMPYEILQWAIPLDDPREIGSIQPTYPAMSGPDQKPAALSTEDAKYLNWYDPTRAQAPQNPVTDLITDEFVPQPLPRFNTVRPEIIVEVNLKGKIQKGVPVILYPMENQGTEPTGSITDEAGKAWIVVPENGKYLAMITVGDRTRCIPVEPERVREYSTVKSVSVEMNF